MAAANLIILLSGFMPPKRKYDTEKELVKGCVRNERLAQEQLYRHFFPTMMGMCMRYTNDREKAMEIVNTGFLRVFRKLDTFSFKGSLEGWIRKLIYHSLSDYFKQHSKYLQFLVFEDHERSEQPAALQNIYAEDILNLVEKLPPATQEVFRLFAIEGFTHVEIAKKASISVGTSKWHLASARQKLKKLLDQNNIQLHAG